MRKSRLLALILTVVFILANVSIPSFAAASFVHGNPADILPKGAYVAAPLPGGAPVHYAYTLDEEGTTYESRASQTGSVGVDNMPVTSDGILNVLPQWNWPGWPTNTNNAPIANATVYQYVRSYDANGVKTDWNSKTSITGVLPPYNFIFDDGITPQTTSDNFVLYGTQFSTHRTVLRVQAGTGFDVTSDASDPDRIYGTTQPGKTKGFYLYPYAAFRTTAATQKVMPFVFEMELKDLTSSIPFPTEMYMIGVASNKLDSEWLDKAVNSGATPGTNFDFANFTTSGWHAYKWIITPNSFTTETGVAYNAGFDLYIDDTLVLADVPATAVMNTGSNNSYLFSAQGVDNLRSYGTTLGFAYDVKVSAPSTAVGSVVTASAFKASMPTNVSDSLEVAIFSADSVNGPYTKVVDGTSYQTTSADDGKIFKAAARVVDFDGCATDWLFSDESVIISDPIVFVTDPAPVLELGNLMAPLAGMPLHISHKVNKNATYSLSGSAAGISISDDGILSITKDAGYFGTNDTINTANVTASAETAFGTLTGPKIDRVFGSFEYNFDDGRLPAEDSKAQNRAPLLETVIKSDASGRIYADSTRADWIEMHTQYIFHNRLGVYMAPFVLEADFYDLTKFRAYYTGEAYRNCFFWAKDGHIDPDWIDFAVNSGATFNPDFDYENFDSRYSWHNYKWVITPNAKVVDDKVVYAHYDLYIDNVLLGTNIPVYYYGTNGSLQDGNNSAYSIYAQSNGIDNFKRYGTSLGFAHSVKATGEFVIGSTLTASAQIGRAPYYNIPETLEYAFFAADSADGTYTKISDGASLELTSAHAGKYIKAAARVKEAIEGGVATEWLLANDATFVPTAAVSAVSLKVNGEAADFETVNVTGDATITVAITASGAGEQAAKFVLAQYAKVNGKDILKAVDLENATVGASADYTLEINAKDVDADTTFKLFALTTEGLKPVKYISFN